MFAFYNIHQLPLFQPESNCGTTNHDNSRLFRHLGENLVDLKIVSTSWLGFQPYDCLHVVPLTCSRIRRNSVLFLSNSKDSYVTLGFLCPRAPAIWLDKMVIFCEVSVTEFWTFASDEVALLVWKGFHISREMHFQDKREKNGCQTLFLSRLTLMPHTVGMILRKILT